MHLLIIRVSVALTFIAINEDFLFPDLDFLAAPTAWLPPPPPPPPPLLSCHVAPPSSWVEVLLVGVATGVLLLTWLEGVATWSSSVSTLASDSWATIHRVGSSSLKIFLTYFWRQWFCSNYRQALIGHFCRHVYVLASGRGCGQLKWRQISLRTLRKQVFAWLKNKKNS